MSCLIHRWSSWSSSWQRVCSGCGKREQHRYFGEPPNAIPPPPDPATWPYCQHGNPPTWCHSCSAISSVVEPEAHIQPSEIFQKLDCQCCYAIDEVALRELLEKIWPAGHSDDCYCARCHAAANGGGR